MESEVVLTSTSEWTMEVVCAKYGVTEQTIRRWIKTRNFPGVKFGHFWRFSPQSVQAWDAAELAKSARGQVAV